MGYLFDGDTHFRGGHAFLGDHLWGTRIFGVAFFLFEDLLFEYFLSFEELFVLFEYFLLASLGYVDVLGSRFRFSGAVATLVFL